MQPCPREPMLCSCSCSCFALLCPPALMDVRSRSSSHHPLLPLPGTNQGGGDESWIGWITTALTYDKIRRLFGSLCASTLASQCLLSSNMTITGSTLNPHRRKLGCMERVSSWPRKWRRQEQCKARGSWSKASGGAAYKWTDCCRGLKELKEARFRITYCTALCCSLHSACRAIGWSWPDKGLLPETWQCHEIGKGSIGR